MHKALQAFRGILLLFSFILIFYNSIGQRKTYVTQQIVGEKPRIDGYGTDRAWNQINWESNFIATVPYDSVEPTFQTEFKILYDENNLYILAHMLDSQPDSINTWLEKRDNSNSDNVSFRFDSYNDKQTAFIFTITASGVLEDQKITNNVNWDINWNAIWEGKTQIDSTGWWAEMKIPLTQFRYNKEKGQEWGLQVKRKLFRYEEVSQWQYRPVNASTIVDHYGKMVGLNYINTKKQLEVIPYVLIQNNRYDPEEKNLLADGNDLLYNMGIDAKIGLTNNFTLDATINPDFGQVEADPSEVNLDVFETFQSERRTFFVEGNNILQKQLTPGSGSLSSDNIFYSRRIGRNPHNILSESDYDYVDNPQGTRILSALKVSGKNKKGLSIGVLESVTRQEKGRYQLNDSIYTVNIEPLTNYFVSSFSKDINNGNSIVSGIVTATNRLNNSDEFQNINTSAYTGMIEYKKYISDKTFLLTTTLFASNIYGSKEAMLDIQTNSRHYFQRPDITHVSVDSSATSMSGWGGTISLNKGGKGNSVFNTWISLRSPSLELNDVGYLRETDHIQHILWYRYRILQPKYFFRKFFVDLNSWTGLDFMGRKKYNGCSVYYEFLFNNFMNLRNGFNINTPGYSNTALRGGPRIRYEGNTEAYVGFSSDSKKKFLLNTNLFFQKGFNSYYGSTNISLEFKYRPFHAISISFVPKYNSYHTEDMYAASESINGKGYYVMSHIDQKTYATEIRLSMYISPKISVDYYGMPFISTGKYNKFKYLNDGLAKKPEDRFIQFEDKNITYNEIENKYSAAFENGTLIEFDNPNYRSSEYKSNIVFKWEYRKASYIYLVWSQFRSEYLNEEQGYSGNIKNVPDIFQISPNNSFVVKMSYLIGR